MNTFEKKTKLIELMKTNKYSDRGMALLLKVDFNVVRTWLAVCRYHGEEALLSPDCTACSESFKMKVVSHLVQTADSLTEVAGKFNLHSRATIRRWSNRYMSDDDRALYYLNREWRDQMKKEQFTSLEAIEKNTTLTETEKLKLQNEFLKAENAYLKKLKALIQEKEKTN